jgi:hypothetical protein
MDNSEFDRERRNQTALDRLGTDNPICDCGQDDWRCLWLFPNEASSTIGDPIILCRNCYRKTRCPHVKSRQSGPNPFFCPFCGEDDLRCRERHHVAGRAFDAWTVDVCSNCHGKLTDMQKGHLS